MSEIRDELFELLLKDAAETVAREEDEAALRLMRECARDPVRPTLRFRLRMRRMLWEYHRARNRQAQRQLRELFPQSRRRVSIRLATAVTLIVLLASVGIANYRGMFEFLLKDKGTHTEIEFTRSEDAEMMKEKLGPEWDMVYYPAYIPEGYELVETNANNVRYSYTYENGEGLIMVSVLRMSHNGEIGIDTEDAEIKQIEILGMEGIQVKKNGFKIVFHDDQFMFTVYCNQLNQDEVVRIAENIKV